MSKNNFWYAELKFEQLKPKIPFSDSVSAGNVSTFFHVFVFRGRIPLIWLFSGIQENKAFLGLSESVNGLFAVGLKRSNRKWPPSEFWGIGPFFIIGLKNEMVQF